MREFETCACTRCYTFTQAVDTLACRTHALAELWCTSNCHPGTRTPWLEPGPRGRVPSPPVGPQAPRAGTAHLELLLRTLLATDLVPRRSHDVRLFAIAPRPPPPAPASAAPARAAALLCAAPDLAAQPKRARCSCKGRTRPTMRRANSSTVSLASLGRAEHTAASGSDVEDCPSSHASSHALDHGPGSSTATAAAAAHGRPVLACHKNPGFHGVQYIMI